MVGGRIIQISEIRPGVTQLWCLDGNDECAVDVETAPAMPLLGDEVWWQSGKVYWDGDRRELKKVGYSYDPRNSKGCDGEGWYRNEKGELVVCEGHGCH